MYDRMVPTEAVAASSKHDVQLNEGPASTTEADASYSSIQLSSAIESSTIDMTCSKHTTPDNGYKDVGFAVAFWLNVAAMLLMALFVGIPYVLTLETNETSTAAPPLAIDDPSTAPEKDATTYPVLTWTSTTVAAVICVTAIALADVGRELRKQSTSTFQVASIGASVIYLLWSFALYTVSSSPIERTAAISTGGILTAFLWRRRLRSLVSFVRVAIHTVSIAIFQNVYVIPISAVSNLVFYFWVAVWAFSVAESLNTQGTSAGEASAGSKSMVVQIFPLKWVGQVISDVVHFVASAAVGAWALVHSNNYEGSLAVRDALLRATKNSFGTICAASLAIGITDSIVVKSKCYCRQTFAVCLAIRVLECMCDCFRVFNTYALVYSALYNTDYLTSGRKVLQLLKRVGLRGLAFDFAFDQITGFIQALIVTITGLLGVTWCLSTRMTTGSYRDGGGDGGADMNAFGDPISVAFEAGVGVGLLLTNSIHFVSLSAARTIFVCLAEQPHRLEHAHPDLYKKLAQALSSATSNSALSQPSSAYSPVERQLRTDEEEGPEKAH